MKNYAEMSLEELRSERRKLFDRHGDEPVRAKFLACALDEAIRLRGPGRKDWVIRDDGIEFQTLSGWKDYRWSMMCDSRYRCYCPRRVL